LQIKTKLEKAESFSATLDIWTSRNNDPFLGVTAHFLNEQFQLEELLIGFQVLRGSDCLALFGYSLRWFFFCRPSLRHVHRCRVDEAPGWDLAEDAGQVVCADCRWRRELPEGDGRGRRHLESLVFCAHPPSMCPSRAQGAMLAVIPLAHIVSGWVFQEVKGETGRVLSVGKVSRQSTLAGDELKAVQDKLGIPRNKAILDVVTRSATLDSIVARYAQSSLLDGPAS
jgi:hypothetical protein